jgi:membrane protein YqaA with SNARE-associated domain
LSTAAGSVLGATVTYLIGSKIGDAGLSRFVANRKLDRLRTRVKTSGALATGLLALLPPPFPLTAFVLTSGALKVRLSPLLLVFAAARVIRFGIEGVLARRYGASVIRVLESDLAQQVVTALVIVSIMVTVIGIARMWQGIGRPRTAAR